MMRPPRKVRLRRNNPRRHTQLLDVATRTFADEGFNKASVNRIAELAGVGVGTLYSYFDDKVDLFLGCVERAAKWDDKLKGERVDEQRPALVMLEAIISADHELMQVDPDGQRLLKSLFYGVNSRLPVTPEALALCSGSTDRVQRALRKGSEEGVFELGDDLALIALVINGLMDTFSGLGQVLAARSDSDGDDGTMAQRAFELLCRGIVKPPTSAAASAGGAAEQPLRPHAATAAGFVAPAQPA